MCLRLHACVCVFVYVCRQKSFRNLLEGNEGAPKKLTTTATDTHLHTHTQAQTDTNASTDCRTLPHTYTHMHTHTQSWGDARLSHVLHIFRHLSYFHEMCTTTHNRQAHTHTNHTLTHTCKHLHTHDTLQITQAWHAHCRPPTKKALGIDFN